MSKALFLPLLALFCSTALAQNLVTIPTVVSIDGEGSPTVYNVEVTGTQGEVTIDLADSADKLFFILPEFKSYQHVIVRQRDQKCFEVADAGPHFTLTTLQGQSTAWKELARVRADTWAGHSATESDFGEVPKYSRSTVLKALKNEVAPEAVEAWTPIAEACQKEPANCLLRCKSEVQISTEYAKGKEAVLFSLTISIPTGC